MNKNSIVEKVDYLLSVAKKGAYDRQDLNEIITMTNEHTDNKILGRVFGYSVSDYAMATLAWLNTLETKEAFRAVFDRIGKVRQEEVKQLIQSKLYLEY